MRSLTKFCAGVAVALAGLSSLAYNGGYENGLLSDTTFGGVTYTGFSNDIVTACEAELICDVLILMFTDDMVVLREEDGQIVAERKL